jgi:hypothetical protein
MRITILALAAATMFAAGCSGDGVTNGANDTNNAAEAPDVSEGNQSTPGQTLQVALERANPIPETPSDTFTVSNVAAGTGIAGPFITADVNHSGCPPYEYKAYWDGSWARSDPPGMTIMMRFGARPGGCKPNVTQTVQINLRDGAGDHRQFWVEVHGGSGQPQRVDVRTDN